MAGWMDWGKRPRVTGSLGELLPQCAAVSLPKFTRSVPQAFCDVM